MNVWPFCAANSELPCDIFPAIGFLVVLVLITIGVALSYIDKVTAKRKNDRREATNQAWLVKNKLPDDTYRSIIQTFFGIGGQYIIGVPEINWKTGKIILSVHINNEILALEVDLDLIRWVKVPGTIIPLARFVFTEEQLSEKFYVDYYYHKSMEAAVNNLTPEKIFRSAFKIEVTVSPEQFKIIDKSLI